MYVKRVIKWKIVIYSVGCMLLYHGFFSPILIVFLPDWTVELIGIFAITIIAGKYSYRHGWLYGILVSVLYASLPLITCLSTGAYFLGKYFGIEYPVFNSTIESIVVYVPIGILGGYIGQKFWDTPTTFLTHEEIFEKFKIKRDFNSFKEAVKNRDINIKIAVMRELNKIVEKKDVYDIMKSMWREEFDKMKERKEVFDSGPYRWSPGALQTMWSSRPYKEPEAYLRKEILENLYRIKGKDWIQDILEGLNDRNEIVRYAAMNILSENLQSGILLRIADMLIDNSFAIRGKAREILNKYEGCKSGLENIDIHEINKKDIEEIKKRIANI